MMNKLLLNSLLFIACLFSGITANAYDGLDSVEPYEKAAKIAVEERSKTQTMTEFDKDTMLISETTRLYEKDGHGATMEMRLVNAYRLEKYDALLNKYYTRLMAKLSSAKEKDALRKAQRCWLAFRDSQMEANDIIIAGQSGSMYLVMASAASVHLVQRRVEELYEIIELKDE